jgi:hypothetical protein
MKYHEVKMLKTTFTGKKKTCQVILLIINYVSRLLAVTEEQNCLR